MPVVTLPDGSQRQFEQPVTVDDLAASIGAGLRKAALGARVNGKLVDTSFLIGSDANVAIITERDAEGLEIIRHSTAHLLAHAVKELFPEAQVTIGPVIEDGFYYDFSFKRPFTTEDLAAIEAKMHALAKADQKVSRRVMARDEAVQFFKDLGEVYKAEIIASIPDKEEISLYGQGNWVDLCRGPHVPSTGRLKAFKLTKVAGAYWRGDSRNEMLQRIYGTAWRDQKELDAYLRMLEEAEKRDHRRIGRDMDLFHLQDDAPGSVFWHDKGYTVWRVLESYIRDRVAEDGYQEVKTPQLMDSRFWEASGHWSKYRENMFVVPDVVPNTVDGEKVFKDEPKEFLALKPMNCPAHVQIFKQGIKSYRDLPIRMAEFGCCHRNEPHGALHGLMRVRQFTQDDAHIFCSEDQILDEVRKFLELFYRVYADFAFHDITIKLATRPAVRAGDDATWDRAEKALEDALKALSLPYVLAPGDGAFYGPKYEFHIKDAIGRSWTLGTCQLDFGTAQRLEASYIGQDGQKHPPVMIHRAVFGSLERFIGILIENYAGKLPAWLAPLQAVVLTITDRQDTYAMSVIETLKKQGFRVEADLRNEKVGFKIRAHTLARVPYLLVAGDKEVAANLLSVRMRSGKDLGTMSVEAFAERLRNEVQSRGREVGEE